MPKTDYDPLQNLKDTCLRVSMRVEDIQKRGYHSSAQVRKRTSNKKILERNLARILFNVKLLIDNEELDEKTILKRASKLNNEHQSGD